MDLLTPKGLNWVLMAALCLLRLVSLTGIILCIYLLTHL